MRSRGIANSSRQLADRAARRPGITLIELVVVIVILAALAALLIPAVQSAREASRKAACINNLRLIALAMTQFDDAKGYLPGFVNQRATTPAGSADFVGWAPPMLAYLERNDLATHYQATGSVPAIASRVDVFVCPSDFLAQQQNAGDALCYFPNAGMSDVDSSDPSIPLDWRENGVSFNQAFRGAAGNKRPAVKLALSELSKGDGIAVTVLLGEHSATDASLTYGVDAVAHWAANWTTFGVAGAQDWKQGLTWAMPSLADKPVIPINQPPPPGDPMGAAHVTSFLYARPSSPHPGGFHLAFCDGRVQFVGSDIRYTKYAALMSSQGVAAKRPGTKVLCPPVWRTTPVTEADF